MDGKVIATYQAGLLVLEEPLDLPEGARVELTVGDVVGLPEHVAEAGGGQMAGHGWSGARALSPQRSPTQRSGHGVLRNWSNVCGIIQYRSMLHALHETNCMNAIDPPSCPPEHSPALP